MAVPPALIAALGTGRVPAPQGPVLEDDVPVDQTAKKKAILGAITPEGYGNG